MNNHDRFKDAIKLCKKNSFISINGEKIKANYLYGYLEDKDNLYLLYSDYVDKNTIFQSIFSLIQNIKIVKYMDSNDEAIICNYIDRDEFSEVTKRLLTQIENQVK